MKKSKTVRKTKKRKPVGSSGLFGDFISSETSRQLSLHEEQINRLVTSWRRLHPPLSVRECALIKSLQDEFAYLKAFAKVAYGFQVVLERYLGKFQGVCS